MIRVLALAALAAAFVSPPTAQEPLAIVGVTVVDGTGAAPRAASTVLVERGRIAAVGPASDIAVPEGARVVDGAGRTLIPGLWDMHAHLSKARAPALPLYVAEGILGVRDVGGDMPELVRWDREIQAGERVGPRIVLAGPYLESATNVLRVLMAETVEPEERTRIPIADPADARRVVDSIAAAGVDFVKIRTWPDLETFRAVADAAAERDLPLAAHTFGLPPEILRQGLVASVEHFYPVPEAWSEDERRAFYRDLAENGTVVVPTIVNVHESLFVPASRFAEIMADSLGRLDPRRPYLSAFLLADWEEQLAERTHEAAAGWREYYPVVLRAWREMHEEGVRLLPGSDLAVIGIYPGSSLHRDLELLVDEVGLSPMEAIVAATGHATAHLGIADSVGTIEVGKAADLVLLEADPMADIAHTRRIAAVVRRGRLLERADLDRLRADALAMPAIAENDWRPAAPSEPLARAIALERSIDEAEEPATVVGALDGLAAFEGAEGLPGGRAALAGRVEAAVNRAGDRLLEAERVDDAVTVLEANAAAFPESGNAWDSLAEAHFARADTARAIEHHRKSLSIDRGNENARERLDELGTPVESSSSGGEIATPRDVTWELRDGRWFDGEGFRPATLWVVNGLFTERAPARVDSVLDLGGLWIVPPFGEAHNHNVEDSRIEEVGRAYLEEGIFYVKNPSSIPRFVEASRPYAARVGTIDVAFAQGGWTVPEGHPTGLYERNLARGVFRPEDGEGAFFRTVTAATDIEAKWADFLADDPDFVKVFLLYSGGPADFAVPGWKGLPPAHVVRLVQRAHAAGLRVTAHVETAADFRLAVAAGVDEIAHLPGFRPGPENRMAPAEIYLVAAEDARRAVELGIVVVTTASFVDFEEAEGLDTAAWRAVVLANLRTLKEAGVSLAVGSDDYGRTSRREAEWLAGLDLFSNAEVLRMWGETTPRAIFPGRRIGRLADGHEASFLALAADPLADFSGTRAIVHRFKQGRRLDVAAPAE